MNDPFEIEQQPAPPSTAYRVVVMLAAFALIGTLPAAAVVWVWTGAAWGVTAGAIGFLLTFLLAALGATIKGDLGR
ncbi:hypothetical protein TPA2_gp11 [Tsukamurella phage TPA2]|uniref:hypothetical protein n=1 Tax=Tsukamurella phage TPA2 TaxID=981330 RepID=UPI0001FF8DA2|nr:hypothetical protein TPA2_gp11 [Tsukamurella phage TPA2]ADX31925.1 hypothetical protein [Tsukamurella phage TPA2]